MYGTFKSGLSSAGGISQRPKLQNLVPAFQARVRDDEVGNCTVYHLARMSRKAQARFARWNKITLAEVEERRHCAPSKEVLELVDSLPVLPETSKPKPDHHVPTRPFCRQAPPAKTVNEAGTENCPTGLSGSSSKRLTQAV